MRSRIEVAAGQTVRLTATGFAITAPLNQFPGAKSGPDGQLWNLSCGQYISAPPPCVLDNAPYGALVGKIGPAGEAFLIGSSTEFTAPANGDLFLAVNDNLVYSSDNQAGYTIVFP